MAQSLTLRIAPQSTEPWISRTSFRQGLVLLLVLNLADAFFTLHWIQAGNATEANPMMEMALAHGPEWFLLSKLALVSLGVYILWQHAEQRMVLLATPAMLLYSGVVGVHLAHLLTV